MAWEDQFIGVGKEGTWGTAVARTEFHRLYPGSFLRHQRPSRPRGFLSDSRDVDNMFFLTESGVGKIRVPLVYEAMRLIMELMFHGVPTTAGAGPYTHEYKNIAGVHVGATAELHMGLPDASLESWLAEGMKVNEWGIDFKVNEECIIDADVSAEKVTQVVKTASPTYPVYDTDIIEPKQCVVEIDDAVTLVESFSFRNNQNIKSDRGFLGNQYIGEQVAAPGFRQVTGQISKEWENKTLYDKFLAGTIAKLEVLATGPGNLAFSLLMNRVQFTGETPEPGEGGIAAQNLPFQALKDDTESSLKMIFTNDLS